MHVPEENLLRYRGLMDLSRKLDSAGGAASGIGGDKGKAHANTLWSMSAHYRAEAQKLRVPKSTFPENRRLLTDLVQANKDAACHHCGGGIGEFKASAVQGDEERFFCHNDVRSCYNERRGNYFDN